MEAGARLSAGLAAAGRDVVLLVDGPTLDAIDVGMLMAAAGVTADGGSVTVVAIRALDERAGEPDRSVSTRRSPSPSARDFTGEEGTWVELDEATRHLADILD